MELENGKIAVLIDAQNTQPKKIAEVFQEISLYGHIVTKRAYSDWKNTSKEWEDVIKNNAITPIQQFSNAKKKNSSDIALVIDAMDLLYSRKYDTFVIVSSDSDFTKLVTRIHDDEIKVIGVGEKKTPQSLVKACDNFIYLENLDSEEEQEKEQETKTVKSDDTQNEESSVVLNKNNIIKQLKIISNKDKYSDDEGWINIGTAGSILKRNDPGFDCRNYGYSTLLKLLKTFDDVIELRQRKNANGRPVINEFRIKDK